MKIKAVKPKDQQCFQ